MKGTSLMFECEKNKHVQKVKILNVKEYVKKGESVYKTL